MGAKVHLHMHVSDLAKSREFYEKFLGGDPVKVKQGYVKFLPAWAPVNLALSTGGPIGTGTIDHVGVQVDSVQTVMTELTRIKDAGLAVVEDAAHGHGGTWKAKGLGSLGQAGTFSFQASKNMTAGEGGLITTDNPELAALCESIAPDGGVDLIDWQMTMLAPVAVELGWLLVGNSGVLPDRPDAVLEVYRRAIAALDGEVIRVSAPYDDRCAYPSDALAAVFGQDEPARSRSADAVLGDWAAQVDLAWIVGLLLRGWRKGADVEAGAVTGWGATAADDLALWSDRALDAAARRL
jgi:catechol 2,3-dioxygenase-like lactoylglutathione lyase family enzyme